MSIFEQIKRQAEAAAAEQAACAEAAAQARREHLQAVAAEADAEPRRRRTARQAKRQVEKARDTERYANTVGLPPELLLALFGDTMPTSARYKITAAPARHSLPDLLPKYYCQRYRVCPWFCREKLALVGLSFSERVDVRVLAAVRWLYCNQ